MNIDRNNSGKLASSSLIRSYVFDLRVVGHPKINPVSRPCFQRTYLYFDSSQKTRVEP
jgi:hypothetical protein